MNRIKYKYLLIPLAGFVLGAIGGYIYYQQIGCSSGTCAITSNPWLSAAFGGFFGYVLFDTVTPSRKKKKDGSEGGK